MGSPGAIRAKTSKTSSRATPGSDAQAERHEGIAAARREPRLGPGRRPYDVDRDVAHSGKGAHRAVHVLEEHVHGRASYRGEGELDRDTARKIGRAHV